MTPEHAAALLGVGVGAGEAEVRAAFRDRARAAHPDSGGSADDLNRLTEARDVLLAVDTGTPAEPSRSTATPQRTAAPRPSTPSAGGSAGRMIYGVVGTVIALFVVAAVVLVVVAIATRGDDEPEVVVDECLIVTPEGVVQVDCDAPGALRVVSEFSGARTCPPGSNSLVVGSTTWCLEPARG